MKIIYIIFAPIPYHYANYLNIENLHKNGFDVDVCDLTNIFYSKEQKKAYFSKTAKYYKPKIKNIININNYEEYKKFLKKNEKNNTIVYYTGRSFYKKYNDNIFFEYLFSLKYKIFLSEFAIEFFPISVKEKIKFPLFLLKNNFISKKYKDLNFIGCGENIEKISKNIFDRLNYYSLPHPNYNWKNFKKNNNTTVYVEESFDSSPDNQVISTTNSTYKGFVLGKNDFLDSKVANKRKFYNKLNTFFSKFEKTYNTKIEISASGKHVYKNNPFQGRKIIYGNTINKICSSNYVIGHSSTALWQCVISKKKLILLSDNLLALPKRAEIKTFSIKSKIPIYQLDDLLSFKKKNLSFNIFDKKKEILFFLNNANKKKSFNQIMIEIFLKKFQKFDKE